MSAFELQWGGKQTYRRGAQRQAGAPGTCCDPGLWCAIATFGTPRGRRIIIQGNNPERTWSWSRLATRPAANHHPHYRPSTIANVSGTAVRNRDPPIRDYDCANSPRHILFSAICWASTTAYSAGASGK